MASKYSSYYWMAWFAACFVTYQQIIDRLRLAYRGGNATVKYLLGVAPNFFPAIGIPALLVVLLPLLNSRAAWFNTHRHITANAISLTGLIAWELMQAGSSKLHFDPNDILWTVIGAVVFQLIWVLSPHRYKAL